MYVDNIIITGNNTTYFISLILMSWKSKKSIYIAFFDGIEIKLLVLVVNLEFMRVSLNS